jgi:hypothetical protein
VKGILIADSASACAWPLAQLAGSRPVAECRPPPTPPLVIVVGDEREKWPAGYALTGTDSNYAPKAETVPGPRPKDFGMGRKRRSRR